MIQASDLSTATWRKASFSNGEGGHCVEVAGSVPHTVPVRDSKIHDSPVLLFSNSGWTSLVVSVKSSLGS